MSGDSDNLVLSNEEKQALIALLKRTFEYARFPLAPRWDPLKAILAKLEPSSASVGTAAAATARHGAKPWAKVDAGGDPFDLRWIG